MFLRVVSLVLAWVPLLAAQAHPSRVAGAKAGLRPCQANALSLSFDGEDGSFNGMSHSGTLFVLRNIGSETCTVPDRPTLTFLDAKKTPVRLELETPHMHPGPAIVPVAVPPDAEVTAKMRWVSNDAYGANNLASPAFIEVHLGKEAIGGAFVATVFGAANTTPSYEMTVLQRDPVYTPAAAVGKP